MESFLISGDITLDEIADALRKCLPGRKITLATGKLDPNQQFSKTEIVLGRTDKGYHQLLDEIDEKDRTIKETEEAAAKAVTNIQALHKQQQDLFNQFVLLRQRYDDLKQSTVKILWNQCAKYHPELRQIPPMEEVTTFVETEDQVGHYIIGDLLGEGQFATVRSCHLDGNFEDEYAIKMIKKEGIASFQSLTRVSNEIDNLRILKSPYVVCVIQAIHTESMLYLITEKGGSDLFEFFEEHPNGVQESWAREIIGNVLRGVMYCHDQEICHRDLKPENILLTFDPRAGKCIDIKLCDFGLSTKFKPKQVLSDFCGSPGFFAPEMIIHGCYFGDKADVWSLGCILMELIMGHEKFCDIWMTAYDYDILQDKEQFTGTISEAVEHLPEYLSFSSGLNDFVLRFLELRASKRPTVRALAGHPWLEGFLAEELSAMSLTRAPSIALSSSPSGSFSFEHDTISGKIGGPVSREMIDAAYSNISEKERKQMEEYIQHQKAENARDEIMHLPPITPATPSITKAKKILRKGNELANTNYGSIMSHLQSNGSCSNSSSSNSNNNHDSKYDQYPYLSMTPETMSPVPSAKPTASSNAFLSPGRSPLPSVAEAHEGSQDPYDHISNSISSNQAYSPMADGKPSLLMSQSDGKIWQGNNNNSGNAILVGIKGGGDE